MRTIQVNITAGIGNKHRLQEERNAFHPWERLIAEILRKKGEYDPNDRLGNPILHKLLKNLSKYKQNIRHIQTNDFNPGN